MWTKHVSVTANQTGHDPLSLKSENYFKYVCNGIKGYRRSQTNVTYFVSLETCQKLGFCHSELKHDQ